MGETGRRDVAKESKDYLDSVLSVFLCTYWTLAKIAYLK